MTGFWIFMCSMNLLIPAAMIGFGCYFIKAAPKSINPVFGYRTTMSMKNKTTWEFAHHYCGRLWRVTGCIMLPLTVAAMLLLLGKDDDTVGNAGALICLLQTAFLTAPIFPTERALKKTFDADGKRRK